MIQSLFTGGKRNENFRSGFDRVCHPKDDVDKDAVVNKVRKKLFIDVLTHLVYLAEPYPDYQYTVFEFDLDLTDESACRIIHGMMVAWTMMSGNLPSMFKLIIPGTK